MPLNHNYPPTKMTVLSTTSNMLHIEYEPMRKVRLDNLEIEEDPSRNYKLKM